jgi:hypothetical protein
MEKMRPSVFLVTLLLAISSYALADQQVNTDPQTQDDVYLWKAPFSKPDLKPFVDVDGYRFRTKEADEKTTQRIRAAIKKDFMGKCDEELVDNWPIYQYALGKDGRLLMVTCISTSYESSSVYYQLTIQNELKLLRFRSPELNNYSKQSNKVPPKITGYKELKMLPNSEILQRRLISRNNWLSGEMRKFQAEWSWKEGHGFTLISYASSVYEKKKVRKATLYP